MKTKTPGGHPAPAGLAALAAGLLACAGLAWTGCEGTTSGVDNPGMAELTVRFRSEEGTALRISGTLDVYGRDQNPASRPTPLATIALNSASSTTLTGKDFLRILAAGKRSAGDTSPADRAEFNLVFRGQAKIGSVATGLAYDARLDAFLVDSGSLERLDLEPAPLVPVQGRIIRGAEHGDLGRVFIPGTPFQATLDDSLFRFEALPSGTFSLRLLTGDGRIFPLNSSLVASDSIGSPVTTLKVADEPIGRLDTSGLGFPEEFRVDVDSVREAFVGVPAVLDAWLWGADSNDARISFLWRQLRGGSADTVVIADPTRLSTRVLFRVEGIFAFELSVNRGGRTYRAVMEMRVRIAPPPAVARMIQPRPGDRLITGRSFPISWEMPREGSASVLFSASGGSEWTLLGGPIQAGPGLAGFAWTPPHSLAPSDRCLIQVRIVSRDSLGVSDTLTAAMAGPFQLVADTLSHIPQ